MFNSANGIIYGIAGWAAGSFLSIIHQKTIQLRKRAACLRAAKEATSDFYDAVDRLLRAVEVSDRLKMALYDLTLAVTDERAGRLGFQAVIDAMEKHERSSLRPATGIDADLQELRKTRPDLYDEFVGAIGAALAALLLAHGPDHSKVHIEFEATRNKPLMLALISRLDAVISDWIASNGSPSTTGGYRTAAA